MGVITKVRAAVTGACCTAEAGFAYGGDGVAMRAYVLVNAMPGRFLELARRIRDVQGVQAADAITGEYDVIVTCESPDINALGALIVDGIQRLEGIHKTTTCLVVS
jgi:DNA-binding Lrp family transcriptional regulator